jgi:ribosomal protein S18 acetylase RimI-like enzyme
MITTRRATPEDIPCLVDMMARFYAESGFLLNRDWASASFAALLGDVRGAAWIASHHDDPAGYVVLTLRHSMEYGGLDGFIDDLYVRPDRRRRGLGRAMLEALFAECRRRNVLALHVEAGQDNVAAQALYRSFGLGVLDDARQLLTARFGSRVGHSKAYLQRVT